MNKKEAWKYYKTWMKEKTYCKALKSEVKITRKGWDHIAFGSSVKRRSAKDRHNKLQLLKLAKMTIKTSATFTPTKMNNTNYYLLRHEMDKYIIKVLLKKDTSGRYYFYSVMKHQKK